MILCLFPWLALRPTFRLCKTAANSTKRAPDGDYPAPGTGTSKIKDSDGDYKPTATAQTMSSSSVQAAISNLKFGG
jgi:hypothetical protein